MRKLIFTLILSFCTLLIYSQTEVGVTDGELTVTLTGTANYNIPISVPPGLNNVEPKIALAYSSQGGNGIAGYGWSIGGLSSITRIGSSKYHDGTQDPVDFDSLDRFSLDGQRLVVKNGTTGVYGANLTVYETESFSNVKITSYGVHPSGAAYGPSYFIVQYPDGSIAHYGNSTDSRSITSWALTYWQNPQSVRINYTYTNITNTLYVDTIKYGAVGALQTLNEIIFTYKDRIRTEQGFTSGINITDSKILANIFVKGNSEGIRNYLLTHEASVLGYEKFQNITEKNGDNTLSYAPTIFEYEESTVTPQITDTENFSIDGVQIGPQYNTNGFTGDFDGDGKTDYILFKKSGQSFFSPSYLLYKDINSGVLNLPITIQFPFYPFTFKFIDMFTSKGINGNLTDGYKNSSKDFWTIVYMSGSSLTDNVFFKTYCYDAVSNTVNLVDEKFMTKPNCIYTPPFGNFLNTTYVRDFKKILKGDFNGD